MSHTEAGEKKSRLILAHLAPSNNPKNYYGCRRIASTKEIHFPQEIINDAYNKLNNHMSRQIRVYLLDQYKGEKPKLNCISALPLSIILVDV